MNTKISKLEGINRIEAIYFNKEEQNEKEKNVEYYIKPDVVIAEGGIG